MGRWWEHYVHNDPRQMGRHDIALFLLTGALLSFGAAAAVILVAGPFAGLHAVRAAHWQWLVLAPLAIAVSHAGYTLAYREAARFEHGPDLAHGDAAALVATGFGAFNPRGGFGLDRRSLAHFGLDEEEAHRRVLMLGIVEYVILAPAAFTTALVMTMRHQPAQAGVLPSWTFGVPAGAVLTFILLAARRFFRRRFLGRRGSDSRRAGSGGRKGPWWLVRLDRALGGVQTTLSFLRSWPGGPVAVAGMGVYWAGEIAALGACLAVFAPGHGSMAALILGYATGYALTRRTLPLAGAGAVEALLPFALLWVAYPLAAAAVAVVAYRVFNLWLTVIPAGAGLIRLRRRPGGLRSLGRPKRDASTVPSA